jgi:type II secretory pathway pseudopilin PulG
MTRTERRVDRRVAFTMLEVLAAIVIVGVLFTVLSGVAAQGLLAEGRNRRWLEASLLADSLVIDLETGLADGQVPDVGHDEEESDPFLVSLDVQAIDPRALLPSEGGTDAWSKNPLFGSETEPSRLRQIEVTVSWPEGIEENRIVRTTFAVDLTNLEFEGAAGATGATGATGVTGATGAAGATPGATQTRPGAAGGAGGSPRAAYGRGKGGKAGSLQQMLERWARNPNK